MTSPTSGSEHLSRYRAIGEFDNLIRAAREAKRALKELREEEAKLNAQSLADDKKLTASRLEKAKAEKQSTDATARALERLKQSGLATKAGQDTGVAFNRGIGQGIEQDSRSTSNKQFLNAATSALKQAFANAGNDSGRAYSRNFKDTVSRETRSSESIIENSVNSLKKAFTKAGDETGKNFVVSVRQRFRRDSQGIFQNSGFEYSLREFKNYNSRSGEDAGIAYVNGYAKRLDRLNTILPGLGQDKLNLDVDVDDAIQSMKAVEFELNRLSHTTADPRVRIDATRALSELRSIQKLFKDEVAENIVKESERIRKELEKIDALPSGRAFRFWALTALSDMARVFEKAEEGTSAFERLRRAAAGGSGGGGNFLRSFISGFDDFSESSSRLLQRLARVSGELYRMPGLIAVIVSALPALVAGFGALVGGALSLASGLGATLGALAAIPGLTFAGIGAIGALTSTFSGLGDAMKAATKAEAEEMEAKEKARLGTDKALTAAQKYKIAMDALDPSTRKVTEALIGFSRKFGEVQGRVGERFFSEVADQTDRLNKLLPITENFLGQSATALGKVADEGIRMITSGPWKRDFAIIAKNNATVISNMGGAGLGLANVFRNIAVAAGPFTNWLTKSLKEGAQSFADWSAQARSNGTIAEFLGETQESLQSLWQILKNVGNVVNSFFQTSVDEGQRYMGLLEDITGRWADVAEAQEAANSPLRQWMTNIRPVLTALGDLISDLSRGLASLASDQSSIKTMIDLLNTLRTEVLPPIFDILRELNESGIAVTVTQALGDMLDAIASFLNSGATTALTVFVTVLANFFELLFNIASLPGVSTVLGSVASAIAALAAVSIVARFTGLFRLWDFFTWMVRNRGNLSGAFADAARNAAGLSTTGETAPPRRIPSSIGGIGSEVLREQARQTERVGTASQTATPRVTTFSKAVSGVATAGSGVRSALGGLVGFLGGPWGLALIGAVTGVSLLASHLAGQKQEAEDTKNAFIALKNAYGELSQGNTDSVNELATSNEKFKDLTENAKEFGVTLTDVSGALNNNDQNLTRVNTQLDQQIATYERLRLAALEAGGPTEAIPYKELKDRAIEFKNAINDVAQAQENSNNLTDNTIALSRTYEERLGGMTDAQVRSKQAAVDMGSEIRLLSNALDTMSSASSTSEQRSRALGDIINYQTQEFTNANEAAENFSGQLLSLRESIEQNGKTLDIHSRAGLRNRDALEAAAKSVRDLYLADIASGTPAEEAIKRHQKRIKELKDEAKFGKDNKKVVDDLIDSYGEIPPSVKTEIETDSSGFAQVYADLKQLSVMQKALAEGKSVDEAQREWNREASGLYRRPPTTTPNSSGPGRGNSRGYATGGPVWGEGSRTSDSIRAWLSNGEFVQPTDAVEHYGMPIMEAIRTRKLDKAIIQEALPDNTRQPFASGGAAHSANCVSCASGGHKFAKGGTPSWPFVVDPKNTKIDKNWIYAGAGALGGLDGPGGWQWQMRVLRQQFPGLPLWSGYRPGARTLSGNPSYHGVGRAVDLPPRRDVAAWIRSNYGAKTKELITPFNDLNLHNGKPHRYTGAVWNQHNFSGGNPHDHWAYRDGGLVDIMKMMNLSLPSVTPQELPSVPRTLSPAASSVINNTTDKTTTIGDIIINNPTAERGGDSIRNALYRTQLLL